MLQRERFGTERAGARAGYLVTAKPGLTTWED